MENSMARVLLEARIKREVQELRKEFFRIIERLQTDNKDNYDDLVALLKDEDLAKKFSLFPENKKNQIRKDILDYTNNTERNLFDFLKDLEVNVKAGIELQALIR